MNIKWPKSMLILVIFTAAGSLSSFLREVYIAYEIGASSDLDIYRLAVSYPYAFFFSFATLLVGIILPRVSRDESSVTFVESSPVSTVSIFVSIIGIAFAGVYAPLLGPDLSIAEINDLAFYCRVAWFGFLLSSIYFHFRIYLQYNKKNNIVASANLICNVGFVVSLWITTTYGMRDLSGLVFAFVVSCGVVSLSFIISARNIADIPVVLSSYFSFGGIKDKVVMRLILSGMIFHFVNISLRAVDRAFASSLGEGWISFLDYAYGLVNGLGAVIGTTFVIYTAKFIALRHDQVGFQYELVKKLLPVYIVTLVVAFIAVVFSEELVRLAYQRGKFSESYTREVGELFKYLMLPFALMVGNMVLLQVLLAISSGVTLILFAVVKFVAKYISMLMLGSLDSADFGVSNLAAELIFFLVFIFYFAIKKTAAGKGIGVGSG